MLEHELGERARQLARGPQHCGGAVLVALDQRRFGLRIDTVDLIGFQNDGTRDRNRQPAARGLQRLQRLGKLG
jgi:hypothetical protein